MKVRFADRFRSSKLDAELPHGGYISIFHLGRGGVNADGTLDAYNRTRVERTLGLASVVAVLRPDANIQIVWTGGCNRKQDRASIARPTSEGEAALRHARTLIRPEDRFTMVAEESSTSTVENATASALLVSDNDTILVVTDPLHYLMRKVQFIFWLVFPKHERIYIQLPTSPPGTNIVKIATHLISTCTTVLGMSFVKRGNARSIQRRQVLLQKYTGH